MALDTATIKKLLDAFEQSDLEVMQIKIGDSEIFISTGEAPLARSTPPAAAPSTASAADFATEKANEPRLGTRQTPADLPSGTPVKSASPGIFWRSPAPGEPPYVEVGQRVEPDSVVGILEVMKLMNPIAAGVSGTVAAIAVENSEQVHKDTVLMVVTPD